MAKKKENPPSENGTQKKVEILPVLQNYVAARLEDQEASVKLPNLLEHIKPCFNGRVMTRQAGRITISVEGSHYRVTLTLPTEKAQTTMIADTLVGVLDALERYLALGTQVYAPTWEKNKKLPTIDDLIQ